MKKVIRIGTRKSRLALYQADLTAAKIKKALPDQEIEIVKISVSADDTAERELDPTSTKRIFTKEIENALIAGEIDMAVHSAKDMAADLPEETVLSAVVAREDARDCLLSVEGASLKALPEGSVVGTSSLRRQLQVLRLRPDLRVKNIRGNVETRIRKMEEGGYEAIILAAAGLKRMGFDHKASEFLSPQKFYPAPGQGVIAIQTRKCAQDELQPALDAVNLPDEFSMLLCERAFLRRLNGGCQLPCGAWFVKEGKKLKAGAALFALSGGGLAEVQAEGAAEQPEAFGASLAEKLLSHGGQSILDAINLEFRKERNA